jgi:hypothetical protein
LRNTLLELRDKRLLEAFLKGKTSIADDLVFLSKTETVLDAIEPDPLLLPAVHRQGRASIHATSAPGIKCPSVSTVTWILLWPIWSFT